MSLDVGIHVSELYHRALFPHPTITDIRPLNALGLKPDKLDSSNSWTNFLYQDKLLVLFQLQPSEVLWGLSLPTTPQLRPGSCILEMFSISNCQTVLSSAALASTEVTYFDL